MDEKNPINLLGVHISRVSAKFLIKFITQTIRDGKKARAVYVNIHGINLAQDLPWFYEFINNSELVYCDGYGVKWGARLLGYSIPERLSPPDWIEDLASDCSAKGYSFYFLGGKLGVAEKVVTIFGYKFPRLRITGVQHGYFDKTPNSTENEAVIQSINAASPDILLVGLGMPLQERWLLENWDKVNARVALPVGALFDYLAGEFPRSPRWMTAHGMEWLGRLIVEPRRLWRRYLIGNPRFLWLVLKQHFGWVHAEEKV